jgi:NADPH:quinone reductase-like Zn-dependent oxidoreductase
LFCGRGESPVYGDFAEHSQSPNDSRITVSAAAISHVVKSRASGRHYTATDRFPFIIGVDGVGRRDDDKRVYFALPGAPYGSMAEQAVVPSAQCFVLPDDLDDVTAAAIANPGVSSWAAYKERARLQVGQTVLVNGATGTAGRLAVQIAKHLGAKKVIATSAVLRSTAIELMGSGVGSIHLDRFAHCTEELLRATISGGFKIATAPVPLSQVEKAWPKDVSTRRTVFTIGPQGS